MFTTKFAWQASIDCGGRPQASTQPTRGAARREALAAAGTRRSTAPMTTRRYPRSLPLRFIAGDISRSTFDPHPSPAQACVVDVLQQSSQTCARRLTPATCCTSLWTEQAAQNVWGSAQSAAAGRGGLTHLIPYADSEGSQHVQPLPTFCLIHWNGYSELRTASGH